MLKILASAPTRVDLGGGTLDITPLHHLLAHKATVNFSVSLHASVTLTTNDKGLFSLTSADQNLKAKGTFAEIVSQKELPLLGRLIGAIWNEKLPALDIETRAESPAGAGLGGSSCLGVTLAGAMTRARTRLDATPALTNRQLVQLVQDVETGLIHAPTGCQDYWGAMNGGFSVIRYPPGAVAIETIPLSRVKGIGDNLLLVFSGKSRASAVNNWQIFRRAFEGDVGVLKTLNAIGETAEHLAQAVINGDLNTLFACSRREWGFRRELWSDIETSETQSIDTAARAAGASFTRVCGAGGGGVMAVFAPGGDLNKIKRAVTEAGGTVLGGTATDRGLSVQDA